MRQKDTITNYKGNSREIDLSGETGPVQLEIEGILSKEGLLNLPAARAKIQQAELLIAKILGDTREAIGLPISNLKFKVDNMGLMRVTIVVEL